MKKVFAILSLSCASALVALPTFAATHEETKPTVNSHKHEAHKKAEGKTKKAHDHAHQHAEDAEKK